MAYTDNITESNWATNHDCQLASSIDDMWNTIENEVQDEIICAVIDTGYAGNTADLSGRFDSFRNFYGVTNYTGGEATNYDLTAGHGSYCASIIGATHNNSGLVVGTALSPVKMMGLRTHITPDFTFASDALWQNVDEAIRYAADNGARVISMSFGALLSDVSGTNQTLIANALDYAYNTKDVVVVSGSGNWATTEHVVPAHTTDCLVVGGLAYSDFSSIYYDIEEEIGSNYGQSGDDWVDMCAPAESVYGYYHPSNTRGSGVSAAIAMVAGVAATIRSIHPSLTAAEVRTILTATANTDAVSAAYIGRRLNANAAIAAAIADYAEVPKTTITVNQGNIQIGFEDGSVTTWNGSEAAKFRWDGGDWQDYSPVYKITEREGSLLEWYGYDGTTTEAVRRVTPDSFVGTPPFVTGSGGGLLPLKGSGGGGFPIRLS